MKHERSKIDETLDVVKWIFMIMISTVNCVTNIDAEFAFSFLHNLFEFIIMRSNDLPITLNGFLWHIFKYYVVILSQILQGLYDMNDVIFSTFESRMKDDFLFIQIFRNYSERFQCLRWG